MQENYTQNECKRYITILETCVFSGFAIFRNTPNALIFLDLVLSKQYWWNVPLRDQDSFAEALLEYTGIEGGRGYDGQCLTHVIYPTYSQADQTMCYHHEMEKVLKAGPWRGRTTRSLRFINPEDVDINFRITDPRVRGLPFVMHAAGSMDKDATLSWTLREKFNLTFNLVGSHFRRGTHCELIARSERDSPHKCTHRSWPNEECISYLCG
jgi:hypothetical protein